MTFVKTLVRPPPDAVPQKYNVLLGGIFQKNITPYQKGKHL